MGHRHRRSLRWAKPAYPNERSAHAESRGLDSEKQVRHKGDWAVKVQNVAPGGWYFEFNNEFYPDVDDSAMVCWA